MIVYHVTDAAHANAIESNGFPDLSGGFTCSSSEQAGIWICDRPVMDLAPTADPVVFELEVSEAALSGCEVIEEDRDYREWLVSASILNGVRRRRVPWTEST